MGPIELRLNGATIDPGGYRQRRLLAALILGAGMVVARDVLAERVWDDGERPANAARAIRTYVSRLRRSLCDAGLPGELMIATQAPGYRLVLEDLPDVDVAVDARRFEDLVAGDHAEVEHGDPSLTARRLDAALDLWRGPPYQEVADRDWALGEVARLVELRQVARERRAAVRLQLGAHTELVAELRQLVEEDPLRGPSVELLMLALYRSNRQADALRVAAAHRRALRDVGLDPSESVVELEARVATSDGSIGRPKPRLGNLPHPTSTFVGRADELVGLVDVAGTTRLLTLTGPGGVGKTRLAVHVASRLMANRDDGVWFVGLGDIDTDRQVAPRVAAALGANDWSGDPVTVLTRRLMTDESLIVLDNCEHVLNGVAALAEVLLERTSVTLMCTSRESLRIDGETVRSVGPLDADAARELFVDRAKAAGADCDARDRAVASICRRLDGLPLAIELVAVRLTTLGLTELDDALRERLLLLAGRRGRVERHRTMRTTIDWSHDLLNPAEQIMFRRVATFAGSFTLDAANAVAGLGDLDASTIVDAVAGLAEKSMIIPYEGAAGRRYRLLEPVRQSSHERLVASGELDAINRAYLEWNVRRWTVLAIELESSDEALAVQHAIDEWDNLVAAADQVARDADLESAFELIWCTRRFAIYRGGFDVVSWASDLCGQPNADKAANFAEAAALVAIGETRRGNYAAAADLVDRALRARTRRPDDVGWRASMAKGLIESGGNRDVLTSLDHYRDVLSFALSPADEAIQCANLGALLRSIAPVEARRHREHATELLDQHSLPPSQRALVLALLAVGHHDPDEVRRYATESANLADHVAATWPAGLARGELFRVAVLHDDPREALDMLHCLLPDLTRSGQLMDASTVLWTAARLLTRLEMHREALVLDDAVLASGVRTLAIHDPALEPLSPDPQRFDRLERERLRAEAAALTRDDAGSLHNISSWLQSVLPTAADSSGQRRVPVARRR